MESNQVIKYVSSNKIYNLPLFETFMLIDCRESHLYEESHIASALNYPPPSINCSDDERRSNLENFVNYASFAYINEIWDPIILYSDNTNQLDLNNHITNFCNLLVDYILKSTLSLDHENELSNQKRQRTNHLFSHISEKTKNIWILEHGFQDFQNNYPFLCVPKTLNDSIGGINMIPLPYHIPIGDGIFIGTRAVQWNIELFNQFKIQSILLDIDSFHKFSQPLTELSLETMISSIPDHISNQQSFSQKWSISKFYQFLDSSTQFIQDNIQQSKRLLIQLYGRSHSCMIIIAWMMRYKSLSFQESHSELMSFISPTQSLKHLRDSFFLRKELEQWQPGGQYLIETDNNDNNNNNNNSIGSNNQLIVK